MPGAIAPTRRAIAYQWPPKEDGGPKNSCSEAQCVKQGVWRDASSSRLKGATVCHAAWTVFSPLRSAATCARCKLLELAEGLRVARIGPAGRVALDVINGGELGKSSWASYILECLRGFEIRKDQPRKVVWLGSERMCF